MGETPAIIASGTSAVHDRWRDCYGVCQVKPSCLLVEDDWHVAITLETLLEDDGFEICGSARSCLGAMPLIEKRSPDVALLDFILDDGSCIPVAQALRERGVPFVVYSGKLENQPPELAGAVWVKKPALFSQLVSELRRLAG